MTDSNQPIQPPLQPPLQSPDTASEPVTADVSNAGLKAVLLLALLISLVLGSVLYVLYARGVFESTQRLVLMADTSDGVSVGMDITFSGFAIGRVSRIELSDEGKARMIVDIAKKDAKWLRSSSVFTLESALVGGSRLRAYSGLLDDPPLEDGALRMLLVGDASAELPRVLGSIKELVQNLSVLTASESALDMTLRNAQVASGKLSGPQGAIGLLVGDDKNAQQLIARAGALLASVDKMAIKADSLIGNADARVFGKDGLMTDAQASVVQLNALLKEARASLRKMDAVLVEAQAVGANARVASNDLGALRADVDINLRRIEQLVNDINRTWPLARDTQIKLP